jgi:hypothetical protein
MFIVDAPRLMSPAPLRAAFTVRSDEPPLVRHFFRDRFGGQRWGDQSGSSSVPAANGVCCQRDDCHLDNPQDQHWPG